MSSRYPGAKPFTREFRNLFYGRTKEVELLSTIIDTHKLTVLFGRSGYGKSSLLNAGVIPKVEPKYEVIPIRFFAYDPSNTTDPFAVTKVCIEKVKERITGPRIFLEELQLSPEKISLWQIIKTLQWQMRGSKKGIILVMDQFEELFTYPKGVNAVGAQLSEILYNRMPADFQKALYEKIENGLSQESQRELELIDDEPPVKILIGIRWDKFAYLNKLIKDIPFLIQNQYELNPLTQSQGLDAIECPAKAPGNFASRRFRLDEQVKREIVDFLTFKGQQDIEAFQLQIICRHIEEKIVPPATGNENAMDADMFVVDSKVVNKELLEDITKKYYSGFITAKIKDPNGAEKDRFDDFEKLAIRYLIEYKLINARDNTRIPVDGSQAINYGLADPGRSSHIIDDLIDSRLIREEPHSRTGVSYELSHDTLITPIREEAKLLGPLFKKLFEFYQAHRKKESGAKFPFRNRAIKKFVHAKAIGATGDVEMMSIANLSAKEIRMAEVLCDQLIFRRIYNRNGDQVAGYELYEQFQNAVIEEKDNKYRGIKRQSDITAILAVVLFFLLGWVAWSSRKNVKLSNKVTALDYIDKYIDTIPDKRTSLRVLNNINAITGDTTGTFSKIESLFKTAAFEKKSDIICGRCRIDGLKINAAGSKIILSYFDNVETDDLKYAQGTTRAPGLAGRRLPKQLQYSTDGTPIDTLMNISSYFFESNDIISGSGYKSDSIIVYFKNKPYIIRKRSPQSYLLDVDSKGNYFLGGGNLPVSFGNIKATQTQEISPTALKKWDVPTISGYAKRIAFYDKNKIEIVTKDNKSVNRVVKSLPENLKVFDCDFLENDRNLLVFAGPNKNNDANYGFVGDDFVMGIGKRVIKYDLNSGNSVEFEHGDYEIISYKCSRDSKYLAMVGLNGDSAKTNIFRSKHFEINLKIFEIQSRKILADTSFFINQSSDIEYDNKWSLDEEDGIIMMTLTPSVDNKTDSTNADLITEFVSLNLRGRTPSIRYFSIPGKLNVIAASPTGDSLVAITKRNKNSVIGLFDMRGRLLHEIYESPNSNYFRNIAYANNIIAFCPGDNRVVIMDLGKPLVNENDPKAILSWMNANAMGPLPNKELKNYIQFATWP